jgi:hypothetical protein
VIRSRPKKIIGLAIGPRSILLAEVGSKGSARAVESLKEFAYPPGLSLSTPAELGRALGQFLRDQKLRTRDVVVGLPARWLVARPKDVPPAAPAAAASTLRLQAESEFATEASDLLVDFAGQTSPEAVTPVLLVATARRYVDACVTLAQTAGLRLSAVSATTLALGRASGGAPGSHGLILNLSDGNAELMVQHGAAPSQLRHLPVDEGAGADAADALVGEIRRTLAAWPQNGSPFHLTVWDGAGHANRGQALGQRLNMAVSSPELRTLAATEGREAQGFAPAVALAVTALDPAGPAVDFLHSRLAPPKPPSKHRRLIWAGVAAGLVVLAVAAGMIDLYHRRAVLTQLRAELKAANDRVQNAEPDVNRVNFVHGWASGKPRLEACLRALRALFPEDDGSIWASSLTLDANASGQLAGKAANHELVVKLADSMRENPHFAGSTIHVQEMRDSARDSRETTFAIFFTYHETQPPPGPAPEPSPALPGVPRSNPRSNP